MEQTSLLEDTTRGIIFNAVADVQAATISTQQVEYIPFVSSFYEGYGHLAEHFEEAAELTKNLKKALQSYITDIDNAKSHIHAVQATAAGMAKQALIIAAVCQRIEVEASATVEATDDDIEEFRRKCEEGLGIKEE